VEYKANREARCDLKKVSMMFGLLLVAVAGLLSASRAQNGHSIWRTYWSYEGPKGPSHWAELDPEYATCNGKEQSPIDIRNAQRADLPPLKFDFKTAPLQNYINNVYTVRVNYHAPGSGDFMTVGDTRYQLVQFHFHHPAEEAVSGKRYPMVLHYMFTSDDGKVVGLAVFLEKGAANATVQKLWDHMPKNVNYENDVPGVEINPADMLPSNTSSYYEYMGSVSAPPCTEGVKWFVLKTPVTVSAEQIVTFAKLWPNDARPVQPLNGRVVQESK